jgi:hypothetical protein
MPGNIERQAEQPDLDISGKVSQHAGAQERQGHPIGHFASPQVVQADSRYQNQKHRCQKHAAILQTSGKGSRQSVINHKQPGFPWLFVPELKCGLPPQSALPPRGGRFIPPKHWRWQSTKLIAIIRSLCFAHTSVQAAQFAGQATGLPLKALRRNSSFFQNPD